MKRLNKSNLTTEKHAAELLLKANREEFYELKGAIDNYEELFRKYWNSYMGKEDQFTIEKKEKWVNEALDKIHSIYNKHRDLINGLMFPELTTDKNESETENKKENNTTTKETTEMVNKNTNHANLNGKEESTLYTIDFDAESRPDDETLAKALELAERMANDENLGFQIDWRQIGYAKDSLNDAIEELAYKKAVYDAVYRSYQYTDHSFIDRAYTEVEQAEYDIEENFARLVRHMKNTLEDIAA